MPSSVGHRFDDKPRHGSMLTDMSDLLGAGSNPRFARIIGSAVPGAITPDGAVMMPTLMGLLKTKD